VTRVTTSREVPACWTWPAPTAEALEKVRRRMVADAEQDGVGWRPSPQDVRWELMDQWKRGRCAICGRRTGRLIEDHDHETGLFRGWLCRACNTCEGYAGDREPFAAYRERSPAIIFNLKSQYSNLYAWGSSTNVTPPASSPGQR